MGVMNRKIADHLRVSPRQTALARVMRRAMTEPEHKLWKALRWRLAIEATHFRRQVPIGPYITDFCSHGAKLIIEVDGNQHGDERSCGMQREQPIYRLKDIGCSAFLTRM